MPKITEIEKIPLSEFGKVNEFISKPTAEGEIAFERSVSEINKSLIRGEAGFTLNIDANKLSFNRVNGGGEVKFGPKEQSYGDYIKESYKSFGDLKFSPEEIQVKQLEMARSIQKGLEFPPEMIRGLQTQIEVNTNPIRAKEILINGEGVKLSPDYFSPKVVENAISPNNKVGPNGEPSSAAKAVAEEVVASSKSGKDLASKTPEELQKATDKVFEEKIKEAKTPEEKAKLQEERSIWKDALKVGLVGLGIFFTYEALSAHAAARSGCFVIITDQTTGATTKCKLPLLTCDREAAAAGDICSFSVDKGWCLPPPTGGTLSPDGCPPCSEGIAQACDKCKGGKDSPCSKYCSTTYMVKSANGKNYDYQCVDCDMKCALNDVANKVIDIIKKTADTFTSFWDLLNNILKYGMYFIIGFIVLYCLYWLITKFVGGGDKQAGDKHEAGEQHIVIEVDPVPKASVPPIQVSNLSNLSNLDYPSPVSSLIPLRFRHKRK